MFDKNEFKKSVKEWIRDNPMASEQDLIDFCDELIPPAQFSAYQWLVDQTVSWYKHIMVSREKNRSLLDDVDQYCD